MRVYISNIHRKCVLASCSWRRTLTFYFRVSLQYSQLVRSRVLFVEAYTHILSSCFSSIFTVGAFSRLVRGGVHSHSIFVFLFNIHSQCVLASCSWKRTLTFYLRVSLQYSQSVRSRVLFVEAYTHILFSCFPSIFTVGAFSRLVRVDVV
jgi:hypothetical protein